MLVPQYAFPEWFAPMETQEWIVGVLPQEGEERPAETQPLENLLSEPCVLSFLLGLEPLIALWAAILKRDYDTSMEPFLAAIVRGLHGWHQVNPEFVTALASVGPKRLDKVVRRWQRLCDLDQPDLAALHQDVKTIAKLAREAQRREVPLWLVVHAPY